MRYIIKSSTCDWSFKHKCPIRYNNEKEFTNWEEAVREFILDFEAKDPPWLFGLDDVDGEVHLYDEYGSCLDSFAFSEEDILKDIIYNDIGLKGDEAKEEFDFYFVPMSKSEKEVLNFYKQLPEYNNMVNKDLARKEDDRIARAYWNILANHSLKYIKPILKACATQDINAISSSGQVVKDIADSMLNKMSEKQLNVAYSICANVLQNTIGEKYHG